MAAAGPGLGWTEKVGRGSTRACGSRESKADDRGEGYVMLHLGVVALPLPWQAATRYFCYVGQAPAVVPSTWSREGRTDEFVQVEIAITLKPGAAYRVHGITATQYIEARWLRELITCS